jgi:hypothetical protein
LVWLLWAEEDYAVLCAYSDAIRPPIPVESLKTKGTKEKDMIKNSRNERSLLLLRHRAQYHLQLAALLTPIYCRQ